MSREIVPVVVAGKKGAAVAVLGELGISDALRPMCIGVGQGITAAIERV